jgi:crotonobetainyl-CoA:carnitine CoA-transferase CaiB-like acyl-CoA transferase
MLGAMWSALGGQPGHEVRLTGDRVLPSCYRMTDLGAASFAAAGLALAELTDIGDPVVVDRTLATGWFHRASRVLTPGPPPKSPFHALSGDFPTADGRWLRFQANYPHLRDAALTALGVAAEGVAAVVATHPADEVEAAVVAGGGAAAATRTVQEWEAHPQGQAVAAEPMVEIHGGTGSGAAWRPSVVERPLAGLRVLDLTRVLAGPLASRFLAACGAQVLRIDPPGYAEPTGHPGDLALGKRCAYLDLREPRGRHRFLDLLSGADVLVHGLRPDALDRLGLGRAERLSHRPDLVEVTLDAYGWTGPWRDRRGFDTLVQASCGMALAGGDWAGTGRPYRWPLSILDHAAGYLMAAAAIRGLTRRLHGEGGSRSRLSLAGIARLLVFAGENGGPELTLPLEGPLDPSVQVTAYGPVRRLVWPLTVGDIQFGWDRPADHYGSATPEWV